MQRQGRARGYEVVYTVTTSIGTSHYGHDEPQEIFNASPNTRVDIPSCLLEELYDPSELDLLASGAHEVYFVLCTHIYKRMIIERVGKLRVLSTIGTTMWCPV